MPNLKHNSNKLGTILIVSISLILVLTLVAYAYLKIATAPVQNSVEQEAVATPIIHNTPEGVSVEIPDHADGTGYSMYVRAYIVVTWYNGPDNLTHRVKPVLGTDYSMEFNLGTGWVKNNADGFYYYVTPVESGEVTEPLVNGYEPLKSSPDYGYALNVEIVTQAIQAAGETDAGVPAVTNAWGVSVNPDGTLNI